MSKAILIMEMPNNCNECSMSYDVKQDLKANICRAGGQCSFNDNSEIKPDWCPLRELPDKKEVCGKYPQPDGITPSYKIGYNACLDEILGGVSSGYHG